MSNLAAGACPGMNRHVLEKAGARVVYDRRGDRTRVSHLQASETVTATKTDVDCFGNRTRSSLVRLDNWVDKTSVCHRLWEGDDRDCHPHGHAMIWCLLYCVRVVLRLNQKRLDLCSAGNLSSGEDPHKGSNLPPRYPSLRS